MNKDRNSTIFNRIRYQIDKTISKGPLSLGAWLALFSLILVLLLSLIVFIAHLDANATFPVIFWDMLLQALAPNPVDVNAGPPTFLIAMLVITLLGIFMVSVFIGIITSSIENRVHSLRRGRSKIVEKNHMIILGWDEHIFTILSELAITYRGRPRACLVVMGDKDKVEMEEEIRSRIGNTGSLEVVCRSGNPINMADLEIVNINAAKSIIVLPPDSEDADSVVIKTLLAITNHPNRRAGDYHIVTEIEDPFNIEAARLVGRHETSILLISDIIAHITAQTCRQTGLSLVYRELMNFEGDEIYFQEEKALVGRTFGESLLLYEDSCVIGIRPKNGKPKLNPSMDTVIASGDEIIAISEDQFSVRLASHPRPPVQESFIQVHQPGPAEPEHTLILGWNQRGETVVRELDHYVSDGSSVKIIANEPIPPAELSQLTRDLTHQVISFSVGNIADRRLLNTLHIETYRHVVLLADLDGVSPQLADARSLITLLHLRDIAEKAGYPFSIVSEMLDVRNRNLAAITRVDDFIVSDELASLLLAQISENPEMYEVFEDLFYSEGSEIFLKPASDYICLGQPVNFYTVVEAARRKNEVALGYRIVNLPADLAGSSGIVVNPDKSKTVTFQEGDRVIVLAEE